MRKLALTVFIIVITPCLVYSQIHIPYGCRIKNEAPGYCSWAAIETIAHAQEVAPLWHLMTKRKKDPDGHVEIAYYENGNLKIIKKIYVPNSGGTPDSILDKMAQMKFTKFKLQRPGTFNEQPIHNALAKKHGAVVQVWWVDKQGGGLHAIVVTHLTNHEVYFIDSNDISKVHVKSYSWFKQYWDGFVFTLD